MPKRKNNYNRHRIDKNAMIESMHPTKKDEDKPNTSQFSKPDVIVFTLTGKEDEELDGLPILTDRFKVRNDGARIVVEASQRDEACAKEIHYPQLTKYYIKRGMHGRLFNPLGLQEEIRHGKIRAGEEEWVYREVSQKTFEFYLDFLTTRNLAYLRNAEREVV